MCTMYTIYVYLYLSLYIHIYIYIYVHNYIYIYIYVYIGSKSLTQFKPTWNSGLPWFLKYHDLKYPVTGLARLVV